MAKPRDDRQKDLLRLALDQIIDMGHPLVRLAGKINWQTTRSRCWRSSRLCQRVRPQAPRIIGRIAGPVALWRTDSSGDPRRAIRFLPTDGAPPERAPP